MVEQIGQILNNKEQPCTNLLQNLISTLMNRSLAVHSNKQRNTYAPWFKELLMEIQENGMPYESLSQLTGISIKTLENFKPTLKQIFPEKQSIDEKTNFIAKAWDGAPPYAKKNLDTFWSHLGRKYPYMNISHEDVRQALINLGLRYPRGPKIKNEGAQVKKKFAPHAIWEGDGKQMTITVNGEIFQFCWYAFVDQNTTLLVGSSITETESSHSFLQSLKDGKDKTGFYAVGVLLDNRMPDSDLGAVKSFCQDHGITIIRTYPGNSKSNGNIESNFSIFEKFIGQVHIQGKNNQEMARSMAMILAEVFTQQRNHSPRKRNGGRTPVEAAHNAERPEEVRSALEQMKNRFEKENARIEEKWKVVENLHNHWGPLSNDSIEKMKKKLAKYPVLDIISACASFMGQVVKYPDNRYGPEYFLAILRNKREEEAKRVYNETFRAGVSLWNDLVPPSLYHSQEKIVATLHDIIREIFDKPTPSEKLLHLESLAWWLVDYSGKASLDQLWKILQEYMEKSIQISLRVWSHVTEFLYSRLGHLLYQKNPRSEADADLLSANIPVFR